MTGGYGLEPISEAQRSELKPIIAAYSAGPPAMAVLYSVLLALKAVVPFIYSLVIWGEAGCSAACTGWDELFELFVGISVAGLLISLLCAFGSGAPISSLGFLHWFSTCCSGLSPRRCTAARATARG